MDLLEIEKSRKRFFAYLCILISTPLVLCFTVIDYFEGDTLEMLLDLIICVIFLGVLAALKKIQRDAEIYNTGLILLSAFFLYLVTVGAGDGTVVYWLFPFPVFFLFYLGRMRGLLASCLFFSILAVLLLNPLSLNIYPYKFETSSRFFISLLFIGIISYGLEASREKYQNLLIDKNHDLIQEKSALEKALSEIKTLSGLIPICSSCKRIRDDQGYWKQVEIYVRDHSHAEFTHGICPDCVKKLYPSLDMNVKRQADQDMDQEPLK